MATIPPKVTDDKKALFVTVHRHITLKMAIGGQAGRRYWSDSGSES